MTLFLMKKLFQQVRKPFTLLPIVNRFIETKKLPHLLFYGPPGTGKTSTIIAIAKKLYGPQAYKNNVLELNASDDRGIAVVRDRIKQFCSTQQLMAKGIKLVIRDECDSMTSTAQFALRRIVEKYTKTTRFCLICNYVTKVIPALQSRTTKFRFSPLDSPAIEAKLGEVVKNEKITIKQEAVDAIVKIAKGDMRKVLNVLESCALSHRAGIEAETVFNVTGRPSKQDVEEIFSALTSLQFSEALEVFMIKKREKSLCLEDIIGEVHAVLMESDLEDNMKIFLVRRMADIEHRLSLGV